MLRRLLAGYRGSWLFAKHPGREPGPRQDATIGIGGLTGGRHASFRPLGDSGQVSDPSRPALTAMCERALLRALRRNSRPDNALPLSTVPRRILAVKLCGLGDSVIVRSILEHLR